MSQQSILITGGGGPAAIAFIDAAASWRDVRVCVADMDPCAAGLYLVPEEQRTLIPPASAPDFTEALLAAAQRLGCGIVLPTVDAELAVLAGQRGRFAQAGISLLMSQDETLRVCLDKWKLLGRCVDSVAVPRTCLLFAAYRGPKPGEVLCAKPRSGSGSRGIRRVTCAEDLAGLPRDGSYMLQAWLPGDEYSVDVVADREGRVLAAVPRLRMKVDSGVAVAARTVRDSALSSAAAEVARAIGLVGVANVQLRKDAHGVPHLLEVNARFPGTMPLTRAAGVDMPRLALDIHLGRPVPRHITHREVAITRRLTDTFMDPREFLTLLTEAAVRAA